MARLLPSKPDPDAPPSEKRLYELFAEKLPHTTTVLHGRRLVLPADGTHTQKNCEIDFLVLDPDRGILVLEVKGGEVRRDASKWYSVDRNNVEHEIKDPARQDCRGARRAPDTLGKDHSLARRPQYHWGEFAPDKSKTPGIR